MKTPYSGRKSMVSNKSYLERGPPSGLGEEWDMVIFFSKGVRDKIEMRSSQL